MAYRLELTSEAKSQLEALKRAEKKLKRVQRCLGLLCSDPRHPGLRSHKCSFLKTPEKKDLWESYVENRTPAAWRVYWFYGLAPGEITIVAITEHP